MKNVNEQRDAEGHRILIKFSVTLYVSAALCSVLNYLTINLSVPQHQEAMISVNLTKLEYERGHFDEAMLLLKIYFIRSEYRLLDSHLSAMRRFVKRKKVIGLSLIHISEPTRPY